MNRRRLILGTGAVAAAGAGITTALVLRRQDTTTASAGDSAEFRNEFDRPDGGKLALANFLGKPLLLNFWATWCAPCVREMPLLDRFAADHKAAGWQVVGLAIDQLEPVREFLAKRPVSYSIAIAGTGALDWIRALGNAGGGLPFSVAYDSAGALRQRKLGELSAETLTSWATTVQ
ncbi:MAG TPA: TlpA disulfide reductase family protein [Burkholderiaceae bacterium]|nr:TlpA disulfide reductase family protein [Burkholderiaceae bacterium]